MDNIVLYDFWIASQARNDGNTNRHCEEERRSNPETTTQTIHDSQYQNMINSVNTEYQCIANLEINRIIWNGEE